MLEISDLFFVASCFILHELGHFIMARSLGFKSKIGISIEGLSNTYWIDKPSLFKETLISSMGIIGLIPTIFISDIGLMWITFFVMLGYSILEVARRIIIYGKEKDA